VSKTKKTDWEFRYSLEPDHYVYGKISNSNNVTFISKIKNKKKLLVGFIIKVHNSTLKKAQEIATFRAGRLTNHISATQGRYFSSALVSYRSKVVNGKQHVGTTFGIKAEIVRTVDLENKALDSMINRDSSFNQKMAHISRGLKASEGSDPITMIKEFYDVFNEDNLPKKIERFKPLRDILSHRKINRPNTMSLLKKNFPNLKIDFRPKKIHLDITNSTNMKELREEAEFLKMEAVSYTFKLYL